MQTKIPILLYCADENLLAAITFALRLHRYDVVATPEPKDVMKLAVGKDTALSYGVFVHAQRGDPAGRLIHLLLEHGSRIPLLLVDRAGDLAPVRYADIVLYGRNTKMTHILAALDTLRRHRQRPRPGRPA